MATEEGCSPHRRSNVINIAAFLASQRAQCAPKDSTINEELDSTAKVGVILQSFVGEKLQAVFLEFGSFGSNKIEGNMTHLN
jgi:hypothetical protein